MATGNMNIGNQAGSKDSLHWPTPEIPLAEDYRMVMAKRAVFQSIASMGLPAFTIHSVVRYSGKMVKGAKSAFIRTWTPIGVCVLDFPDREIVTLTVVIVGSCCGPLPALFLRSPS